MATKENLLLGGLDDSRLLSCQVSKSFLNQDASALGCRNNCRHQQQQQQFFFTQP